MAFSSVIPFLPPWLETAATCARPALAAHLPLLAATAAAVAGAWALCGAARLVAAHRTLAAWPAPPTTSWLLGHGPALATPAHHLVLAAWARACGRAFTLRVAWKRAVVVTDPALAAAILDARPGRTGLDKGDLYSRFNALNPDPGRGTVFTSPSDAHWAAVRAGVARCFTPKAVRARFGALEGPPAAAAAWLAERAGGGKAEGGGKAGGGGKAESGGKAGGGGKAEGGGKAMAPTTTSPATSTTTTPSTAAATPPALFDADDLMMRAALDAVASACFGLTCGAVPAPGCAPAPAIFETMRACQDWLNTAAMAPWAPLVGYFSRAARAGRAAVRRKKAYALDLAATLARRGGDGDPTSASTALLAIVDPATGRPLAPPRLAGEAVTLLEAGFETTGHTAAYTLALLARHPAAQAAAVAELEGAGLVWRSDGQAGRALAAADLAALPFLSACVKEAMRLFPVVGDGPVRTAARTVTLTAAGGSTGAPQTLTIPAGTLVLVPFFAAGRDPAA